MCECDATCTGSQRRMSHSCSLSAIDKVYLLNLEPGWWPASPSNSVFMDPCVDKPSCYHVVLGHKLSCYTL